MSLRQHDTIETVPDQRSADREGLGSGLARLCAAVSDNLPDAILAVTNDTATVERLQAIFRDTAATLAVSVAHNAAAAFEQLRPALVLLDWSGDGGQALNTCAALAHLEAAQSTPILLLRDNPTPEEETLGLSAGAAAVVRKPLVPVLTRAIADRQIQLGRRLKSAEGRLRTGAFKDAIVQMLETAALVIPLSVQLERILDIVSSVSWLEGTGEGVVYLTDETGVLMPVASRGLGQAGRAACHQATAGDCICGSVAAGHRHRFVPHVSDLPGLCGTMDGDRAAFILPLRKENRPQGVLLLYLRAGHTPRRDEFEFMGDLAACVSALVSRRVMESVVEIQNFEIQAAQSDVIRVLGLAGEYRDEDTGLHVWRVGHFARCIAEAAGLSKEESEILFQAAPMHDIGKIGIPDAILHKPGRLTEQEAATMQMHTLIGEQILHGNDPLIVTARTIAGSHHEKWDGTGYPRRLAGEDIPLFGRICALADVFDALGQKRPYKQPWPLEKILTFIQDQSGRHFDPMLVAAFFSNLTEILRFRSLYTDSASSACRPLYIQPLPPSGDEAFPWKDEYSLGLPSIDEHHRHLFNLVNVLSQTLQRGGSLTEIGKAMKALENYILIHFQEEERLMAQCNYRRYDLHRIQHAEFAAHINRAWVRLRRSPLLAAHKILHFLGSWLVQHVQSADREAAKAILAFLETTTTQSEKTA